MKVQITTLYYRVTVTEADGTVTHSAPYREEVLLTQDVRSRKDDVLTHIQKLVKSRLVLLKVSDDEFTFIKNPQKVTVKFF